VRATKKPHDQRKRGYTDKAINDFLNRYCEELDAGEGVSRRGGAPDEVVRSVSERYRARFGLDLPSTYIEICKREDGIARDGVVLYGLVTRQEPGEEFPWTEGLLENYDSHVFEVGDEAFIPFGHGDGRYELFGLDGMDSRFVRVLRHRRDRMKTYPDFDEMLRDMFLIES